MSSFNSSNGSSNNTSNNFLLSGSTSITTDVSFSNQSFVDVLSTTIDTSSYTGTTVLIAWAYVTGSLTSGTGSFNWKITLDGSTLVEGGNAVSKAISVRTTGVSSGTHTLKLQVQSTNSGGTISIRPQTQLAESCWLLWQITNT